MSIEQPEFEIEIDADLDRKADELLEVYKVNVDAGLRGYSQFYFHDVDYDDVVNSLLESTSDAVLSKDIHYKARLYNMLLQKTDTKDLFLTERRLFLTSVDNYRARLYGLALEKIKLDFLTIEGTHGLDDAALLVDWVRNGDLLYDLSLKSIKNEGVLASFIQAAKANSKIDKINIEDSHLTPSVIQMILDQMPREPEKQKLFDVEPCLEFHFERDWNRNRNWYVAIRIKHINDKLPTDLVTLVTHLIQNCTTLKRVIFDSISNDTNDLLLLDAVVTST